MNILLITDSYPPEIRSASQIMQELAEGLSSNGYKVYVATCYPKYNLSQFHKNQFYPKFTTKNDIGIIRIKTLPHHKVNFLLRGISQLLLPYIYIYNIKKYVKNNIDVVIVYSPPLTLAKIGIKFKKKDKVKYLLNVQDIFPQNAIDLGILRNKRLIKYFETIERNAYEYADDIIVHSKSNKLFLEHNKNITGSKIQVIHNWIDISQYYSLKRTGMFRKKYEIDNKLIFLFGGIMGPSQGLELIIKIAAKLKEIPEILFLFVGDGTDIGRLGKMAETFGLKNVIFKPFVTKEEYPQLVKDADIGLVCLSSKNKTPVVPGKILSYMAAGIPIIAFLNRESDAHSIVSDAGCGYTAISNDEDSSYRLILRIYNEKNKLKSLGENGYKYARTHFDKTIGLKAIEGLIHR